MNSILVTRSSMPEYEEYCNENPDYRNNIAVATIKHIKNMYQKHLEEDSFL